MQGTTPCPQHQHFMGTHIVEAVWPSGWGAGFEICRSRIQIRFWPLADVALDSLEFNFSLRL